jgi:DNA polymerase-3 subunit alpha
MAAVLSSDMNNTDKVVPFIGDCRQMGLAILAPDINASDLEFTVESGAIRYGLGAIKGAGEAALDAILTERREGGGFADLFDLARRVDLRKVNKRVLEALIAAGALDSIAPGRAALYEALDTALERGSQLQQDRAVGQDSLFGDLPVAGDAGAAYPDVADLESRERLRGEKHTLGLYLTGHPLDDRMEEIATVTDGRLRDLMPAEGSNVAVAGMVAGLKEIFTRNGQRMAFLTLEDPSAQVEVTVFADTYEPVRDWVREEDALAVVEGKAEADDHSGGYKVNASRILTLEEARVERARALELAVPSRSEADMDYLGELLGRHPGHCPVQIHYRIPGRARARLRMPQPVRPDPDLLQALEGLLGPEAVSVRFQG